MTISAGAADAVASPPLADPAALWPWAEANQGLLSVLALAAAFGIAAWEIRQSVRRDQRALAAYIDWVLSCADRSIELTDDAIRYMDSEGKDPMGVGLGSWIFLTGNALATLEEIQPMRPTHPELTHFVNRLMRCMDTKVDIERPPAEVRERLEDHKTYVVIHRDHVARFCPRTVAERLGALWRGRAATAGLAARPANFR